MKNPDVSIIIPNYKTEALTKLCLRSIRKHTDLSRLQILVVDNDSADGSLDYLRKLPWIELIERKTDGESGCAMHINALELALKQVISPLVLVMHTDTIVISDDWLDFLLDKLNADPRNAGVGSWKLEYVSPWKKFGQKIETAIRRLLGRKILDRKHYFRSHCAFYRTDLVRKAGGFADPVTAGEKLFHTLAAAGYKLPFIDSAEMLHHLRHLNHATSILNPSGSDRKTASSAARRKLEKELRAIHAREIIADDSLDR